MYGKMFRQMYHGTLATTGPWQALVTFQQFIVLANSDGIVDMTPEAISRETTIPIEIIKIGIAALEQPDADSRTPDEEGRRIVKLAPERTWGWRVVNYLQYRQLKREEDRREYHRRYWHKRKANSTDSTATQHTQPSQPIADADADAKGKKRAARASAQATRLPDDFELTLERKKFCESERKNPERTFANFTDYWRAASGAKARKADWDATWRNWCRREEYSPRGKDAPDPKASALTSEREWARLKLEAERVGFRAPLPVENPQVYETAMRLANPEQRRDMSGILDLTKRLKA